MVVVVGCVLTAELDFVSQPQRWQCMRSGQQRIHVVEWHGCDICQHKQRLLSHSDMQEAFMSWLCFWIFVQVEAQGHTESLTQYSCGTFGYKDYDVFTTRLFQSSNPMRYSRKGRHDQSNSVRIGKMHVKSMQFCVEENNPYLLWNLLWKTRQRVVLSNMVDGTMLLFQIDAHQHCIYIYPMPSEFVLDTMTCFCGSVV